MLWPPRVHFGDFSLGIAVLVTLATVTAASIQLTFSTPQASTVNPVVDLGDKCYYCY